MQEIASWDREFHLWTFSVSHSRLLLRSVNVDDQDTRIDVLFSGVERLNLPSSFQHLQIHKLDAPEVPAIIRDELNNLHRTHIFLLNGQDFFVQATHCQWHQDIGGPATPSKFGPFRKVE
ncbi:hypothetical protein AB0C81_21165 [Streptomyces roseoverticillatus]|uniref:hypothetical protein n=1 Tax=Streptomyces roseoverticillatus TaxID=66429 RepID=UPI003410824A